MTEKTPTPRQVVEQLFRAWELRDADGAINLYAEDIVQEWPFAHGHPTRLQGRETLRKRREEMQKLHAQYELKSEYGDFTWYETDDPEVVIVEYEVHGETTITGPFSRQYIYVFRVRDGKIVLFRDYADNAGTEGFEKNLTGAVAGAAGGE